MQQLLSVFLFFVPVVGKIFLAFAPADYCFDSNGNQIDCNQISGNAVCGCLILLAAAFGVYSFLNSSSK